MFPHFLEKLFHAFARELSIAAVLVSLNAEDGVFNATRDYIDSTKLESANVTL